MAKNYGLKLINDDESVNCCLEKYTMSATFVLKENNQEIVAKQCLVHAR